MPCNSSYYAFVRRLNTSIIQYCDVVTTGVATIGIKAQPRGFETLGEMAGFDKGRLERWIEVRQL